MLNSSFTAEAVSFFFNHKILPVKKNLSLLVFTFHLSPFTIVAQSFLNGVVSDALTSKPLAFATVQLPELHLLVYSDSSGKFSIHNLPEGNFILKVSFIGYESFVQTVSVSQAKNILPIKLEPIEVETEEVVIYGTHQNDWRNTPMDIVSLSRDDISGRGNLSLSSAIAKLPGMGEKIGRAHV